MSDRQKSTQQRHGSKTHRNDGEDTNCEVTVLVGWAVKYGCILCPGELRVQVLQDSLLERQGIDDRVRSGLGLGGEIVALPRYSIPGILRREYQGTNKDLNFRL